MNRQQLGKLLESKRIQAGLSKHKLSKASGLSRWQIIAMENGTINFTIDSLLSYLKACNIETLLEKDVRNEKNI